MTSDTGESKPVTPVLPRGRQWTTQDLKAWAAGPLQYELIDGVIYVVPSPFTHHQTAVDRLGTLLEAACPAGLEVSTGSADWQPDKHTSLRPDVLVTKEKAVDADNITTVLPLLVIEVILPPTRLKDLVLKRSLYADLGLRSYWIFDPSEISFTALELTNGDYAEVGRAIGDETLRLQIPYPVEIVPARLLD